MWSPTLSGHTVSALEDLHCYMSTDSLVPRLSSKTYLFFVGARGEPGNEADVQMSMGIRTSAKCHFKPGVCVL